MAERTAPLTACTQMHNPTEVADEFPPRGQSADSRTSVYQLERWSSRIAAMPAMEPFFLEPSNRDFAEGRGPYQPRDLTRSASRAGMWSKLLMTAGALATVGAGLVYLYQDLEHEQLLANVKTVTAEVIGCEGSGKYSRTRFRYTVDGKVYDQPAYARWPEFVEYDTLIEACKTTKVELKYLPSDPTRWSVSPFTPFTRDEREAKPNTDMFIPGPIIFVLGAIFAFACLVIRKQIDRQETLKAGIVLSAELLRVVEDTDDESPNNVICHYQFKNPAGLWMKGQSGTYKKGLKKCDYPPPGTPVYVIYASDKVFQML